MIRLTPKDIVLEQYQISCGNFIAETKKYVYLNHKIPLWFFLTALLQTPQGNLVGPGFIETSPLSNRIRHK
jgi:hypothetical protein